MSDYVSFDWMRILKSPIIEIHFSIFKIQQTRRLLFIIIIIIIIITTCCYYYDYDHIVVHVKQFNS